MKKKVISNIISGFTDIEKLNKKIQDLREKLDILKKKKLIEISCVKNV